MPVGLKGFQKGNKICLGRKLSDETKRKISERRKNDPSTNLPYKPFLGKKHTEETKEKIRKSHLGTLNANYGKSHSEETKAKWRVLRKGSGNPNWKGGISKIDRIKNPNKSMLSKSAIAKGKLFENFVAEQLRKSGLDPHARRTFGSGSGLEKGDVYNSLGLNIECKNTVRFSLNKYWMQSVRDADKGHAIPVLIWHPPNQPMESSAVFIPLDYFLELLKHWKGEITITNIQSNELKWAVRNLVEAGKKVDRLLENE